MAKKAAGGRPVIYGPKDGAIQVRSITKKGAGILDRVRRVVKSVSQWPGHVSDGDILDYLLRCWLVGQDAADAELKAQKENQFDDARS